MTKLYISEFSRIGSDHGSASIQAPMARGIIESLVEIGAISAQSKIFSDTTRLILVHAESECHLAFGDDPKASTDFHKLAAGETRYYSVSAGSRLAVVGAL